MFRRFSVLSILLWLCLLISGCSWNKTTTDINSDVTVIQPVEPKWTISELTEENLLPSKLAGTKNISFAGTNISVSDDGMRDVFVTNTGALATEVFARLTTPGDPAEKTQVSLKQATVSVGGSIVTIPDGAELAPHLSWYNVTITTSGNDLVLQAHKTIAPYESYLLIDGSLSQNYLITNPQDWFWNAIYMIPQKTPSLLKFMRWSDVQSVNIFYASGDSSRSLANGYEDRWAGIYTLSEEVLVPGKTKLHITSWLPSSQVKLYHVVFDQTAKTLVPWVQNISPVAKDHLASYAEQKWFGVSAFDELTITASGDRNITLTDAKEQALFVVEPSYSYLFPLHNYPFVVELQQDASDEYRPYYSRLLTTYLLDETAVVKELEGLFGKKNVHYQNREKWFSYEIQPQQDYTWTLAVTNIYGQVAEVKTNYRIESMSPKAITQDIVSNNTISILPRSGIFKDVLIQYKNIPSFSVQFQACTVWSAPDLLSTYKGVGIENYLFTCTGKTVTQEVKPIDEEFMYRKAYRTPLEIPEALSGADAFKVFFKDQRGQEQAHYMLKSDLGLWTKIADDQLWVWWFTFGDGQPLKNGEVKVTTLEWATLGTATIKDGLAKISLPKQFDTYDYATQWKKDSYLVDVTTATERAFVVAHRSGWGDLSVPADSPNGSERYLKINSKLDISEISSSSNQINQRGMVDPVKIYGYTDRWLYKAGDTIYFAWWVRNILRFDDLDYLKNMHVAVTLTNPMGGDPVVLTGLMLDTFGWFDGSYTLPSTLPLGEYFIEYRLDDRVAYSHNVKVEEYQKPTFFVDMSHEIGDENVSLVMQPSYFFGSPLQKYDVQVTWSLVGKDICRYCRWWNENDYYFNHVFNDSLSTGGTFTLYNQTSERLVKSLYPASLQAQKGYQYTLKVDAIVKDRLSDETQFITKHIDFKPEVMVWVSGQPYEWLYRDKKTTDPRSNRKIDGVLQEGKWLVTNLRYEVYRWSYDQQLQQWIDGNAYYVNGQTYLPVTSGSLAVKDSFILTGSWITEPGEYFVRVLAEDATWNVVGEVQKRLSWYAWSADEESDLLGAVPNNYTLTVDIPKKTYKEGEEIPLNIVPYQRDARVVVTIERGQYIIDSFLKKLDGTQLKIPVKKGYAPNVIINVMMLQWTEMNGSVRKEPRFFAGYAEAKVDTSMHELNISIVPKKMNYLPWEQVSLDIITTDDAGKPIDARVSVAVVDQALASLYTILKEPLPYFFNTVGTSIFTYTNMKLLYQSLKAFATWGAKWWAGNGWKAMFSYIRDDLKDAAFRSGAVYTKGWKATVTFTAPENLTTWLVDTIAISADTRLGTASTWFVVKKDLIIEPNAPLFVTIWDQLTIPVKVVVPADAARGGKVTWSAWIQNHQGERLDLGTFAVEPNKTLALDVTIPKTRWTSAYVELMVAWTYGAAQDGIKQIIPLRAEGLISRDSVWTINKVWTHTFTLPESLTQSLSVRLAQLPTNFIDPIASYLIRYPYGCTEQLLSSLLPLIAVEQLREKWVFTSPLLSWSTVITDAWPVEIRSALRDGIAKLLAHQRPDGWFGYRVFTETEEVTRSNYLLSAYVYHALKMLESIDWNTLSLAGPLSRLDGFLTTYRTTAPEWWYWYLLTKATHGITLTQEEMQSLEQIQLNETSYLPLLRYLIAVAQQDTDAIKTRRLVAKIPTNTDERTDTNIFWNPVSATAMKLRALIDDPEATQQERSDLLLSLLKQREESGLRGRSTQSNVQVLLTLSKLAEFRIPKKVIACTIQVDGKEYPVSIMTGSEWIDLVFSWTTVKVDWSCDSPLLADVAVSFLPKDLEKTLWAASHVSDMMWSISDPTANIGAKVDIVGSFSTDLAWEQVAVELFIPSNYKLLEVISSKMPVWTPDAYGYTPVQTPFTVSDRHCQPTHRETRFDRLFLYYDTLQPGVCDITIPALKAYSGTTTLMPMRVWEMYKGLINGRKVIVQ